MALTLTDRVELGDVDARRTLCGTYIDTRHGDPVTINVAGATRNFADVAHWSEICEGWMPYGEYAWPTVLRLVEAGTWTRKDDGS